MTWGDLLRSLPKDKQEAFAEQFARGVVWAIYGDLFIICGAFAAGALFFVLMCVGGLI